MNQKFTLGFSPCPNDTFMFDAMVHGKIDLENLEFVPVMQDIESLNQGALKANLDITKLSFPAFARATGDYTLLTSGCALGKGVGPLFISKKEFSNPAIEVKRVAIPGMHTTANFLFSLYFPEINEKTEMVFSEIEDAVLTGKVDAGIIIHENRFTYEGKGLKKICDLGELWEKDTGLPIPLGGIAIRSSIPKDIREKVNRVLRRSIEFAFANPGSSRSYVNEHSRELSEVVQLQHINLYVNSYSINLGEQGKSAINKFLERINSNSLMRLNAPVSFVEV